MSPAGESSSTNQRHPVRLELDDEQTQRYLSRRKCANTIHVPVTRSILGSEPVLRGRFLCHTAFEPIGSTRCLSPGRR